MNEEDLHKLRCKLELISHFSQFNKKSVSDQLEKEKINSITKLFLSNQKIILKGS